MSSSFRNGTKGFKYLGGEEEEFAETLAEKNRTEQGTNIITQKNSNGHEKVVKEDEEADSNNGNINYDNGVYPMKISPTSPVSPLPHYAHSSPTAASSTPRSTTSSRVLPIISPPPGTFAANGASHSVFSVNSPSPSVNNHYPASLFSSSLHSAPSAVDPSSGETRDLNGRERKDGFKEDDDDDHKAGGGGGDDEGEKATRKSERKPLAYGSHGETSSDVDKFEVISRAPSSPPPEAESNRSDMTCLLYLVVLFAAVTGLLMGYDLCIVAVVLDPVKDAFNVCGGKFVCTAKQLFVSMVAPGAVIGSLFGGFVSDWLGRRLTLALSDVCFVAGSLLMGLGEVYWVLLLGRVCIGLGVGIGFVVFSTYISELAPRDRRGQLVACQEVAQCAGCLLSYSIALAAGNSAWRWLLGAAGIIAFIQIIGIAILPESPRWYVRQNKLNRAIDVLKKISNEDDEKIQQTAFQIQSEYEEELRMQAAHYSQNKFSRHLNELLDHKFQLCIAVGCAFCQNMTAANSVLYYSNDIFKLAGVEDPFLPGVGLGFMKLLGVICCMLLVESWGRKKLLLLGSVGTFFCHILFIVAFAIQDAAGGDMLMMGYEEMAGGGVGVPVGGAAGGETPGGIAPPGQVNYAAVKLAVVTMLTYMFFWNISWAGLMFVVASEILPSSIRGIGMGLTITTFWLLAFLVQSTLESAFYYITKPGTFGLYAFFNFLVILFVWFVVPETTGQSLEEISNKYRRDSARGIGVLGGLHGGEEEEGRNINDDYKDNDENEENKEKRYSDDVRMHISSNNINNNSDETIKVRSKKSKEHFENDKLHEHINYSNYRDGIFNVGVKDYDSVSTSSRHSCNNNSSTNDKSVVHRKKKSSIYVKNAALGRNSNNNSSSHDIHSNESLIHPQRLESNTSNSSNSTINSFDSQRINSNTYHDKNVPIKIF